MTYSGSVAELRQRVAQDTADMPINELWSPQTTTPDVAGTPPDIKFFHLPKSVHDIIEPLKHCSGSLIFNQHFWPVCGDQAKEWRRSQGNTDDMTMLEIVAQVWVKSQIVWRDFTNGLTEGSIPLSLISEHFEGLQTG